MKEEPVVDALSGGAVWGQHRVDGETRLVVGPMELRLRIQSGELWIAGRGKVGALPLDWTRWVGPHSDQVIVLPTLPDRPVVVAPESPFRLVPGANARIFVRIPLCVRIALAEIPDTPLLEAPTIVMSDTWWGDHASGDLAYWLPTTARRHVSDDLFEPHVLMCPMEIANRSDEVLSVEKLLVRVKYMPVFRDGAKLWSAETRVTYEAAEEGSGVEVGDEPPLEAGDAELLSPPRERSERGLRGRTFDRFMALTGW